MTTTTTKTAMDDIREKLGKRTKQSLLTELQKIGQNAGKFPKELQDRIVYTNKKASEKLTNVKKADLIDLTTDIVSALSAPAPVEASLKPRKKLSTEKDASKEPAEKEQTFHKVAGPSKEKPEVIPSIAPKAITPALKLFPSVLDVKDLGKLKAVPSMYTKFDDLKKAVEDGKQVYIAAYWNPRQIKQFGYSQAFMVKAPKSFENDLDVLQVVLTCETMQRLFAMSFYTEAMYRFDADYFVPIEDTDPRSGEKFKIRVAENMEFELYVPVEEEK